MNRQPSDTGPDTDAGNSATEDAASRDSRATDAATVRADTGAAHQGRQGGHLPEGTATDVPPPDGTSVDAPRVQGIYRPDVGPGGADIDESDRVLPNRGRTARKPESPSAPGEQPPLRRSQPR